MWAHPGKQLLFMGQEFAQGAEWAESRSLDWWLLDGPDHRGVARLIRDLNRAYTETNALWSQDITPSGFQWIDANDASGNTFSFLRFGTDGSAVACVVNFSPVPHDEFRLGLPYAGRWQELINTDAEAYFGSGVGNFGGVDAVAESWHGQPASVTLRVPPLGALWLRYGQPEDGAASAGFEDSRATEQRRVEAIEVQAATVGADAGVPPADALAPVDATTLEAGVDPAPAKATPASAAPSPAKATPASAAPSPAKATPASAPPSPAKEQPSGAKPATAAAPAPAPAQPSGANPKQPPDKEPPTGPGRRAGRVGPG